MTTGQKSQVIKTHLLTALLTNFYIRLAIFTFILWDGPVLLTTCTL